MKELVKTDNGQIVTTSLLVAEKFGKEHRHVLDAIRNLVAENSAATSLFVRSEYENRGKMYPMFIMNKDGFSLLVMGFTGSQALQFKMEFINAFNKMEEMLNSDDYILQRSQEILVRRIDEERQKRLEAEAIIKRQAPKVLFADAVATSDRSVLVAELAKIINQNGVNVGQNRLFVWLRENGFLCSRGEYYNQPTQHAMDLGLFELKKTTITKPNGTILVGTTTKVTGKGQIYLLNKFFEGYREKRLNKIISKAKVEY